MSSVLDPEDSLLSVPADPLHALFDSHSSVASTDSAGATPSPESADDDKQSADSQSAAAVAEKKPVKKRKSWGQELPVPKTNLPPRKRAKTEDEKEQRRIERVLRNRAAAQSSRERKRKEVEGLEEEKENMKRQNAMLAARLQQAELENQELSRTVAKLAAEMTVFRNIVQAGLSPVAAADAGQPRQMSPTLSADLLPLKGSAAAAAAAAAHVKRELPDFDLALPAAHITVDPRDSVFSAPTPADAPNPADDSAVFVAAASAAAAASTATATTMIADLTQHPAAMLCDLQCQSAVWCSTAAAAADSSSSSNTPQMAPMTSRFTAQASSSTTTTVALFWTVYHLLLATMASTVSSRLTQPLAEIFRSLKHGCPLSATTAASVETLVPLIHWLISTPTNPLSSSSAATTTTTTTTSTTTTTKMSTATTLASSPRSQCSRRARQPSPTTTTTTTSTTNTSTSASTIFRTNLLRRLLASSPALARPLRDATGRALRLMSSGDAVAGSGSSCGSGSSGSSGNGGGGGGGGGGDARQGIEVKQRALGQDDERGTAKQDSGSDGGAGGVNRGAGGEGNAAHADSLRAMLWAIDSWIHEHRPQHQHHHNHYQSTQGQEQRRQRPGGPLPPPPPPRRPDNPPAEVRRLCDVLSTLFPLDERGEGTHTHHHHHHQHDTHAAGDFPPPASRFWAAGKKL